jgi:hypothetical protein
MDTNIDLDFETLVYEKKRIATILLGDIEEQKKLANFFRDFDREKFKFHIRNSFLLLITAEKLLFPPSIEPKHLDIDRLDKLKKFANLNLD